MKIIPSQVADHICLVLYRCRIQQTSARTYSTKETCIYPCANCIWLHPALTTSAQYGLNPLQLMLVASSVITKVTGVSAHLLHLMVVPQYQIDLFDRLGL